MIIGPVVSRKKVHEGRKTILHISKDFTPFLYVQNFFKALRYIQKLLYSSKYIQGIMYFFLTK